MFQYDDIVFRAVEEDDLRFLYIMRQDEEINDALFVLYPVSLYGQKRWLEKISFDEKNKVFMVDVERKPIGYVKLADIDFINRRVEVGLDLEVEYRGKGYGKKVYRALLEYCFKHMGMNQVYLYCLESNIRGIKCYESVGFKSIGILKDWVWKSGKYQNVNMMTVFNSGITSI